MKILQKRRSNVITVLGPHSEFGTDLCKRRTLKLHLLHATSISFCHLLPRIPAFLLAMYVESTLCSDLESWTFQAQKINYFLWTCDVPFLAISFSQMAISSLWYLFITVIQVDIKPLPTGVLALPDEFILWLLWAGLWESRQESPVFAGNP